MASVRQQIVAAFVAALKVASAGGMSKPTGLNVHRFRQTPIEKDDLPAICVFPQGQQTETQAHIDHNLNRLTIRCELRVKLTTLTVDETLEPLLMWVQRAIKEDETFGGIAMQCIEGAISWEEEIMEAGYGSASYDWEVEFFTEESDPEAQ